MGKGSFKHLGSDQRRQIEVGLNQGCTLVDIADVVGCDVSTVRREILRNRRADGPSGSFKRDKNDCAYLKTCKVRGLCGDRCGGGRCRLCHEPCERTCGDYRARECRTVLKAPFVCNACRRYSTCSLPRYRYSAEAAQASADRRAVESRDGADLTKEEMDVLVGRVKGGLSKGQSVHHIFATQEMPCSERSLYRYIERGDVPILSIELSKKVRYRKRAPVRKPTHAGGFYAGHEYADLLKLPVEERAALTEVDTVLGRRGDRKCILSLHRVDLHFQIYLLLPARDASSVVAALDWLECCCGGAERFGDLFGLMLPDRGSEFDDISGMETDPQTHLRRCTCYFADPNRPDQKGACEKNHVELRKILPKGTSLEGLDSATLADICSHVNSTVRRGCGDATPFDLASSIFPRELFDNLGLRPIPSEDVVATPGILYRP